MKLETIYNELVEIINDDMNFIKAIKLKEKLEQKIREETCYKTTSKTRVNAIKRIASKEDCRPVLQGYGIMDDYKCVTDSYHAIMIHEDNMPLKLVTTDEETIKKLGKDNCIHGTYPNFKTITPEVDNEEYNKIKLDLNDIMQFYKLHKNHAREEYYVIEHVKVNIVYLKNVIDALGEDITTYLPVKDYRPVVIKNKDNEIGIVLPIKTY